MTTQQQFEEFAMAYDLYFYSKEELTFVELEHYKLVLNFDLMKFVCKVEGITTVSTSDLDGLLDYVDFQF